MALNIKILMPLDHPPPVEPPLSTKVYLAFSESGLDLDDHGLEKRAEDRQKLRSKIEEELKNSKKKLNILSSR
jgi:hypothetical protein